jgi:formyltetrahydrofolate deformylase
MQRRSKKASERESDLKNTAILLVQCPDRKGLDATIAEFIYRYDGNILHFEQHQAGEERFYLARVEWELDGFRLDLKDFDAAFGPIAHKFGMNWCTALGNYRPRVAIFVSRYDHCLVDLLYRQRSGELACDFLLIVSNHHDAKRHADFYGIPFHHIPVSKENKQEAEAQQLALLRANNVNLVVLARYMQVLSTDFMVHFPWPIINIHHSFLPAFIGAKPHHQAYERGVKLIGATAH